MFDIFVRKLATKSKMNLIDESIIRGSLNEAAFIDVSLSAVVQCGSQSGGWMKFELWENLENR